MSKIFELFGYRLDSWGAQAETNRKRAWCPFMNAECDGGGNRYNSGIDLRTQSDLAKYFPSMTTVQSGVCSIQLREGEQPWVVCPRRLLSLKNGSCEHQQNVVSVLLEKSEILIGNTVRVWSEVKIRVETKTEDDEQKMFDYSFDYVLAGVAKRTVADVSSLIGKSPSSTKSIAEENGYTLALRDGVYWIDDFPSDPIVIVEIMTSSTSGGNKSKRTQIAMAFEDAVKHGMNHNGPGINYRQVWARMVSQLIVKSQVGTAWNGKTIWLLQDTLADYISSSTALNLRKYISRTPDEVNILSVGYGDVVKERTSEAIAKLPETTFYSGPVSDSSAGKGFVEIVKVGAVPPKDALWRSIFLKKSCATLTA